MKKTAVLLVFGVLLVSGMTGIDLSLVPGVSVKNLMLYVMVAWITLDAALDGSRGGFLNRPHPYLPLHIAFVFFILLAATSAVVCVLFLDLPDYSLAYGIASLKSFAVDPYLMLLVFLAGVRNSGEAVWVMKGMLAILTVVSLLSLADAYGVVDLGILEPRSDSRFSGPLGGPNSYGGLMGVYIPPAIAFAHVSRGPTRALWLASAGTLLVLLLSTASRGALVGLVAGAFLGAILLRRHVSARYLIRIFAASAALMLVALVLLLMRHPDMLYERFVWQAGGDVYTQSSGRSMIWGDALSQMADAPASLLVGFGWKTFDLMHDLASHNQYLDYFFNLGIIGLTLILIVYGLVVSYVTNGVRSASGDSKAILAGFLVGYLSYLVAGLFSNSLWLFIWASAGVALRLAADSAGVVSARITGVQARRMRELPQWDDAI